MSKPREGACRRVLSWDEAWRKHWIAVQQYREGNWIHVGLQHLTPQDRRHFHDHLLESERL